MAQCTINADGDSRQPHRVLGLHRLLTPTKSKAVSIIQIPKQVLGDTEAPVSPIMARNPIQLCEIFQAIIMHLIFTVSTKMHEDTARTPTVRGATSIEGVPPEQTALTSHSLGLFTMTMIIEGATVAMGTTIGATSRVAIDLGHARQWIYMTSRRYGSTHLKDWMVKSIFRFRDFFEDFISFYTTVELGP
jgi:hypothetical protein